MHGKRHKRGFTIVETLAAILAFSILMLSVGIMLVRGWNGWRHTNEAVAMQRDATLAMKVILREIRSSSLDDITISGNRIDFAADGEVRVQPESIELQGSDLVYTGPGGSALNLLNGTVATFTPSVQNDHIEVILDYQSASGDWLGRKEMAVYARNE